MSAMDQMLVRVIHQVIPPEVMELLTTEKIQELGERINAYIISTRESLDTIIEVQAKQEASLRKLLADVEGLKNASGNGNKRGGAGSKSSGSGS